jgi:hypothetical protein
MKISEGLDRSEWVGWGIYSLPTTSNRWLISAGDGRTGQSCAPLDNQCALSGARHVSATVRVRSSWPLERLVVSLVRTVWWPLTLQLWLLCDTIHHCTLCAVDRWRAGSRCSAGSPDSPVAHRTVRWIIAEAALDFPESGWFGGRLAGARDSVRCTIFQHTLSLAPFLIVSLTWFLSWFVLNLMRL